MKITKELLKKLINEVISKESMLLDSPAIAQGRKEAEYDKSKKSDEE